MLDALLDQPMKQAITELNLADHIRQGLFDPTSPKGKRLALVLALEQGDWEKVSNLTNHGKLFDIRDLNRWQAEAFGWDDDMMSGLIRLPLPFFPFRRGASFGGCCSGYC